jgi:HCOMODA/2-hydroxy-3-carboxy-muconic semialdehyde decarboxylase
MIGVVRLLISAIVGLVFALAHAQTPPASAGPVDPALIEDLVAANRVLAQEGIFDAYGHVSMRHPGNQNRYLMSRSLAPALVTANDILEFDLDSNSVDPKGPRSVLERFIHGEVYKARPDVKAVIHSHSPTVVPFSVTKVPLRPVMHNATFLWVGVPVWEIRDAGGPGTDMLVRNAVLGRSLAATLGDKPVALMRGHGSVVAAPDLQMAVRYAIYTEINARQLATALALGGPISYISPEEGAARDKNPGDFARAWELWKKQALGK